MFFFNDTATTEIYTLSLHYALPIWLNKAIARMKVGNSRDALVMANKAIELGTIRPAIAYYVRGVANEEQGRSEEHTSELQSRQYLVCRLLLEKKKNKYRRS